MSGKLSSKKEKITPYHIYTRYRSTELSPTRVPLKQLNTFVLYTEKVLISTFSCVSYAYHMRISLKSQMGLPHFVEEDLVFLSWVLSGLKNS